MVAAEVISSVVSSLNGHCPPFQAHRSRVFAWRARYAVISHLRGVIWIESLQRVALMVSPKVVGFVRQHLYWELDYAMIFLELPSVFAQCI